MTDKTFSELCSASNAELEAILQSALAPDFNRLVGSEWRGVNTSALPRLLGLQKFIKGFFL